MRTELLSIPQQVYPHMRFSLVPILLHYTSQMLEQITHQEPADYSHCLQGKLVELRELIEVNIVEAAETATELLLQAAETATELLLQGACKVTS